jgi:hypothetical protein
MAEDPSRNEKHCIQVFHLARQQQQQEFELQLQSESVWEGLYAQYGSPELRHEFLIPRPPPMHRLSAAQKMELLMQDAEETLAFSSPDERAKLHADWEWDLAAQSDGLASWHFWWRGYSRWSLEEQSKRRRSRALSRLDTECSHSWLNSLRNYILQMQNFAAEALADVEAATAAAAAAGVGAG